MQIPFSSVYIVLANYEKIRIYFLYTLLEIYGKKKQLETSGSDAHYHIGTHES